MVFVENGAVIMGHSCSLKTRYPGHRYIAFEADILGGEMVIVLFFFIQFFSGKFSVVQRLF